MTMTTPQLRPISKPEELAKIPVDQPVLVELPPGVVPFASPEGDGDKPVTVETPAPSGADEGVESLKQQLAKFQEGERQSQQEQIRLQQERDEARRAREEALAEAERIRAESKQSTKEFFGSAIDGAKAECEAAEMAFKAAYEQQDGAAIAKAHSRIARAEAKLLSLESAQANFDAAPAPTSRQQAPQGHVQSDVLAQIDNAPNLLPKERTWLKQHPEAIIDAGRNQELGVAYMRAQRKGLERGSDAYFAFLDEFMGFGGMASGAASAAPVSAPVSRGTPSNGNGSGSSSRVHLSPEQRELARSMGLSDVQYAAQVMRLEGAKRDDPDRYRDRQ